MARVRTISHYVRGIRIGYRALIMRVFRVKLTQQGIGRRRGGGYPVNAKTRMALSDSIFKIEDRLESRNEGQPEHPAVLEMNAARLKVEDDLWGDPWDGN